MQIHMHSTDQKYTANIIKKTVKIWTPENIDQLKGCFECSDLNVMIDSSTNVDQATDVIISYIDQATDVIISYIRFCEDIIVSKKTINKFSQQQTLDRKGNQ